MEKASGIWRQTWKKHQCYISYGKPINPDSSEWLITIFPFHTQPERSRLDEPFLPLLFFEDYHRGREAARLMKAQQQLWSNASNMFLHTCPPPFTFIAVSDKLVAYMQRLGGTVCISDQTHHLRSFILRERRTTYRHIPCIWMHGKKRLLKITSPPFL